MYKWHVVLFSSLHLCQTKLGVRLTVFWSEFTVTLGKSLLFFPGTTSFGYEMNMKIFSLPNFTGLLWGSVGIIFAWTVKWIKQGQNVTCDCSYSWHIFPWCYITHTKKYFYFPSYICAVGQFLSVYSQYKTQLFSHFLLYVNYLKWKC